MENKNYFRGIWILALGIGAIWLSFSYLLPVLMPFLIGFGLSRAAEPLIRTLQRSDKLPRWLCSTLSMGLLYLGLGLLIFFGMRKLIAELQEFAAQLPSMLAALEEPLQSLRLWLEHLAQKLPAGLGTSLREAIDSIFASGSVVAESLYRWLIGIVTGTVGSLPDIMLFLFTAILSSFMLSSEWPGLRRAIAKRLPASIRRPCSKLISRLRSALGGWLRAQVRLIFITFLIVTLGLWILRTDYPLLLGAGIALIDALPVLGTGTVMIPWAVVVLMQGQTAKGIGLLVVYGAASFTRTALEPKLLGKQIGLPPVVTLFALYAGFRFMGVVGMIVFPIIAILLKQFLDLWDGQKKNCNRPSPEVK